VNDQLHKMSNDIATEHTLSEQIMDLREMKATIREQLHMTETTLQETRMELARLERRESEQSSKIMALENDLRSRQPVEDPKSAMRLHELDTLNQDLRKDLIDKGTETSSMREQLQQKEEVMQQLRDQCLKTHTELGEARQQIETLQLEKTQSQKAAVVEIEEMRLFLSKAADQELDDLKSKHLNAIQQLKLKKSPVEDKFKETSLQLIMMRQEKESYEMEAASANAALEAEKNQREDQVC